MQDRARAEPRVTALTIDTPAEKIAPLARARVDEPTRPLITGTTPEHTAIEVRLNIPLNGPLPHTTRPGGRPRARRRWSPARCYRASRRW